MGQKRTLKRCGRRGIMGVGDEIMGRTDEAICRQVSEYIARYAPRVDYTDKEVERAFAAMDAGDLEVLRAGGLLGDDFELYWVLTRFLSGCGVLDAMSPRQMGLFYRHARRFDPAGFTGNPYIRAVHPEDAQIGAYRLCMQRYEPGEFFQYDMPDLSADPMYLKLGFFSKGVSFPGIYEGDIPWMSVCPSEIASMAAPIERARGRMLVLGLGLGYYPFMISLKNEVSSITIVERQKEIIDLFTRHLLPFFPEKRKIRIVQADAFSYLETVQNGQYDGCFADIWENQFDGAEAYPRIMAQARRLSGTRFDCWIEDAIKYVLNSHIF